MIHHEFSLSREVETTLDHTESPVYYPVTREDGVVMGCDDFLDEILRADDFVIFPQSAILEVLTLVVFELPCDWVETVREDLGVLSVVFHPVVEHGSCRCDEASNDVVNVGRTGP